MWSILIHSNHWSVVIQSVLCVINSINIKKQIKKAFFLLPSSALPCILKLYNLVIRTSSYLVFITHIHLRGFFQYISMRKLLVSYTGQISNTVIWEAHRDYLENTRWNIYWLCFLHFIVHSLCIYTLILFIQIFIKECGFIEFYKLWESLGIKLKNLFKHTICIEMIYVWPHVK